MLPGLATKALAWEDAGPVAISGSVLNPPIPGLCSVVCTTYNHAAYCGQSLQSIFDQTYREIEIVIVDDGSKDGNVAALRAKLESSPFPSTLIAQENTGKVGLNINRGVAAATGEYVCFMSLDDLLRPDCIDSKIGLLRQDRNMVLVANTTFDEMDGEGNLLVTGSESPLVGKNLTTSAEMLEHEFEHIGTFFMQGAVIRRDVVEAIGGYDIDMIGDDLIVRTKIWKYMVERPELTFALQSAPGFVYRKHGTNLHRDSFRQLRTVLEWRDRYFPGRPLPDLFTGWANYFFSNCIAERNHAELQKALEYSPEIRVRYDAFRGTWKYRRRAAKRFLRRLFGIAR